MIKRLPQFAEHHFAALCASAGVVCNASDQDECGWDFFLQFPANRSNRRSADLQPVGPEALVQVKSTREAPLIARMKLSNALRAAQASQPFFMILVVSDVPAPRVYARHFWQVEIERTLRRIRLAERDGDRTFNRRHFDLRMVEADRHDDLLGWMRNTIEDVRPSYAAEKTRITATVGHENGFGSMEMTFKGSAEDLLDLHLGLIESLPIIEARYVSERFGIEAPGPEMEISDAQLYVEPVGTPCRLRLQGGSPTSELFANAVFYSAELPDSETTQHRWRVDAGPLRILGGGGKYDANLTVRFEDRRRLSDLRIFLTMVAWRGVGPVGLQLFLEDKRIPMGSLTIDAGGDGADWRELRSWVNELDRLAQAAPHVDPEVSLIDLDRAAPFLSRFAGFVGSPSIRMEYDPDATDDPTRAAVYYVGCDVGEWCFLAVIERTTRTDEIEGGRRRITFGAPQLLDAIVRRGSWHQHREEIESAYRAQIERLGKPETLWELNELEAFISKFSSPRARQANRAMKA